MSIPIIIIWACHHRFNAYRFIVVAIKRRQTSKIGVCVCVCACHATFWQFISTQIVYVRLILSANRQKKNNDYQTYEICTMTVSSFSQRFNDCVRESSRD